VTQKLTRTGDTEDVVVTGDATDCVGSIVRAIRTKPVEWNTKLVVALNVQ
jgi:hypothetical protein